MGKAENGGTQLHVFESQLRDLDDLMVKLAAKVSPSTLSDRPCLEPMFGDTVTIPQFWSLERHRQRLLKAAYACAPASKKASEYQLLLGCGPHPLCSCAGGCTFPEQRQFLRPLLHQSMSIAGALAGLFHPGSVICSGSPCFLWFSLMPD